MHLLLLMLLSPLLVFHIHCNELHLILLLLYTPDAATPACCLLIGLLLASQLIPFLLCTLPLLL